MPQHRDRSWWKGLLHRYLDYNATCPMLDDVGEIVSRTAKSASGNPSSLHWAGRAARKALDDARDKVAKYLNVESGSVVFTSGGTESNNMAIHGWLATQEPGSIVTSSIEHPSVLAPLKLWSEKKDWNLTCINPESHGAVCVDRFCQQIADDTRLVCLMLANNETGVVQPIQQVIQYCRDRGIAVLIDAVQGLGKLPLDLKQLDADFVSISAHKVGGPRGVGALIVRRGVKVGEFIQGGGQERKRRSGTENVPGIAGFAEALGMIDYPSLILLRDGFEQSLQQILPDVCFFGKAAERVANTSMFSMPGLDGETLLMQLDLAGFAISSGSACSSGKREASHVLLAMGVDQIKARCSIRVSFGPDSTKEDADALIDELVKIRQRLRAMAG
ncbi:MAG: cysteine desulfurase family protein [Mariprofundaceae bacterium]